MRHPKLTHCRNQSSISTLGYLLQSEIRLSLKSAIQYYTGFSKHSDKMLPSCPTMKCTVEMFASEYRNVVSVKNHSYGKRLLRWNDFSWYHDLGRRGWFYFQPAAHVGLRFSHHIENLPEIPHPTLHWYNIKRLADTQSQNLIFPNDRWAETVLLFLRRTSQRFQHLFMYFPVGWWLWSVEVKIPTSYLRLSEQPPFIHLCPGGSENHIFVSSFRAPRDTVINKHGL